MIYAIIGFAIMLGVLVGIGINQPRGSSMKMWLIGYFAISIIFDILVVLALLNQSAPQYAPLTETLLGLSAGAATGLAIHVAHHMTEEQHAEETGKKEKSGMFGF
jgi:hypothetical protein